MHFFASVSRSVCTDVSSCFHNLSNLLILTAWCAKEEIHAL